MNSFLFLSTLKSSNDGLSYLNLIQKVQKENRGIKREKGFEIHHIHPQALGGKKDTSNLIKLSIREHIEAHYWLALVFGGSMYYAFRMLTNRTVKHLSEVEKDSLELNLDRWALVREQASSLPKPPVSKETREKIAASHRGKKQSLESNLKRSLTLKDRPSPKKGKKDSESTLKKKVEFQQKLHANPEYRKKLKEAQQNPELRKRRSDLMKGHLTSDETRKKISKAAKGKKQNEEWIKRRSESLKGNICVFKAGKGIRIRPENLQKYLEQGYSRTRKESLVLSS